MACTPLVGRGSLLYVTALGKKGGLGYFPKKNPVSGFARKNNLTLKRVKNNLSLKRVKKITWPGLKKIIKKYPCSLQRKSLHFILFL